MTARICLLVATLALGCKASSLVGNTPARDLATAATADAASSDDLAVATGPDLLSLGPDLALPRPCGADQCHGAETCQSAEGCCSCGSFAGYCLGETWTCGHPGANDPGCPATEPTSLSACDNPNVGHCWYCAADGPHDAQCWVGGPTSWCPAGQNCWVIAGPGGRCD
jgi:hypothetical protein